MANLSPKKNSKFNPGRFLKKFTVKNVKTFRSEACLDFCLPNGKIAQWTVILGENGVGKTTLLQYIAGLIPVNDIEIIRQLKSKEQSLPPFRPLFFGGDWLEWHASNLPRPWQRPMILHASLELSNATQSISETDGKPNKDGSGKLDMTLTFSETSDARPHITANYKVPADLDFFDEVKVFGYGAGRHVAGPASPYLSSDSFLQSEQVSPVHTLFRDDFPLISPEQWLLSLDHRSRGQDKDASEASRTLNSARQCLSSVLPGIRSIKVAPHGLLQGQSNMTVLCETSYGTVPFSSLSLGYRTMAAWLTDFMKRMHFSYAHLKDPNKGSAVVLVDEFDLHMHPSWQRDAMQALSRAFPNTQFIISAHSPLVVQGTEGNAKLAVLRRQSIGADKSESIIDSNPQYAAGWRVDQILTSDLYNISPRSEKYTKLMNERIRLRQIKSLTEKQHARLKKIETQLDEEAPPGLSGSSKQLLAKLQEALQK